MIAFVILSIASIYLIYQIINEKFKYLDNAILTFCSSLILILILLFQFGLISNSIFDVNSILIAEKDESANCFTKFKVIDNFNFTESSSCTKQVIKGNYTKQGDTLNFINVEPYSNIQIFYDFAIIKNIQTDEMYNFQIFFYKNQNDTNPRKLVVLKNKFD